MARHKFGNARTSRTNVVGRQVPELPKPQIQKIESFAEGLDQESAPEQTSAQASSDAQDVLVDDRNRLARMAGVETIANLQYKPSAMFVHPNLDSDADVVFISSPYVGHRQGTVVSWQNAGVPAGEDWAATLHGGTLLFSNNRTDVYARPLGTNNVVGLGWGEAGALQSFAGRVFAGNANIGGQRNPLGIKWTGASGEYNDINSTTAGFELLLTDAAENDRIIALETMNDAQLAVILRKSIWIGQQTYDAFRPVNFVPKVIGKGAVNARTVAMTNRGIFLLSDDGVYLFNGQTTELVSQKINAELLPLKLNQSQRYHAVYSIVDQTYTLFTPDQSFVLDLRANRWLRSTLKSDYAVSLSNPLSADVLQGAGWGISWGNAWGGVGESSEGSSNYDTGLFVLGTMLGRKNSAVTTYFGTEQQPYWTTPEADVGAFIDQAQYQYFEYDASGIGEFIAQVPNMLGEYVDYVNCPVNIPTARPHTYRLHQVATGQGIGVRIKITTGNPIISRFALKYLPSGGRV